MLEALIQIKLSRDQESKEVVLTPCFPELLRLL